MDIKFKSWDEHFNEMLSPEETEFFNEDGKLVSYYYAGRKHPLYEDGKTIKVYCKLLQYIGRLDKNGKEIYEGDILNGGDYNGSYRYGVVIRKGHEFYSIPTGKFGEGFSTNFNQMEVIGNIYENKELI